MEHTPLLWGVDYVRKMLLIFTEVCFLASDARVSLDLY